MKTFVGPLAADAGVHRDRVVPKVGLLGEVWGDQFVSESAVTSRIGEIRRATGDDGRSQRVVKNVRGRGYRVVVGTVGGTHRLTRVNVSSVEPRGLGFRDWTTGRGLTFGLTVHWSGGPYWRSPRGLSGVSRRSRRGRSGRACAPTCRPVLLVSARRSR